MSKLTSELKEEHQILTEKMTDLKRIGITSLAGKELMLDSKEILLQHLKREDDELYPVLKEKAKTNPTLKVTLETFGSEMEKITEFAINFFNKYEKNGFDKESFIKDISTFIITLKSRIMKEEVAIFKAYDNYVKN